MAWRIHDQVIRVVIDNRIRNRVTGFVYLTGRPQPLRLQLQGNAWPDMAGCELIVESSAAKPGDLEGLATEQRGACGDMTASRKVTGGIPPLVLMYLMIQKLQPGRHVLQGIFPRRRGTQKLDAQPG